MEEENESNFMSSYKRFALDAEEDINIMEEMLKSPIYVSQNITADYIFEQNKRVFDSLELFLEMDSYAKKRENSKEEDMERAGIIFGLNSRLLDFFKKIEKKEIFPEINFINFIDSPADILNPLKNYQNNFILIQFGERADNLMKGFIEKLSGVPLETINGEGLSDSAFIPDSLKLNNDDSDYQKEWKNLAYRIINEAYKFNLILSGDIEIKDESQINLVYERKNKLFSSINNFIEHNLEKTPIIVSEAYKRTSMSALIDNELKELVKSCQKKQKEVNFKAEKVLPVIIRQLDKIPLETYRMYYNARHK